jgi:hypothetical protein
MMILKPQYSYKTRIKSASAALHASLPIGGGKLYHKFNYYGLAAAHLNLID